MSRQYPRFLFSDPQNTKSKGPFIIHALDPIIVIKISIVPPKTSWRNPKNLYLSDDRFLYEVVLSKADTDKESLTVVSFAIEWFQGQSEYKTSFIEWFYNLIDDNGANSWTSNFKLNKNEEFICYDYIYRVDDFENDMVNCFRIRVANPEDYNHLPSLDK